MLGDAVTEISEVPEEVGEEELSAELAALESRFPDYPTRLMWFLVAVSIVDNTDRTVLSTAFEDIKRAFGISDADLGLLTGAYSLVAALSVIPFGFLADRTRRTVLIALGFIPWSLAMFWQGAATSFGMMFVARLFLGSIEATNGPSTPSLMGDYFRVERRTWMFGIQGMGATLGYAIGLFGGGAMITLFGWRYTFVIWGVIGLAMGALVLRVLPEPERGLPDAIYRTQTRLTEWRAGRRPDLQASVELPGPSVDGMEADLVGPMSPVDYRTLSAKDAMRQVARIKTMWILLFASMLAAFFTSGLTTWPPTFFRRYHEMTAAAAGAVTGANALLATAGVVIGARLGDRLVVRGRPRDRLFMIAGGNFAAGVIYFGAFATEDTTVAVALYVAGSLAITLPVAPTLAMMLGDIIAPQLRGRASALTAIVRVAGTTAAPILFGVLSDAFGLRTALLAMVPAALAGSVVTLFAYWSYLPDMAGAQEAALRQHRLEVADELATRDQTTEP